MGNFHGKDENKMLEKTFFILNSHDQKLRAKYYAAKKTNSTSKKRTPRLKKERRVTQICLQNSSLFQKILTFLFLRHY